MAVSPLMTKSPKIITNGSRMPGDKAMARIPE